MWVVNWQLRTTGKHLIARLPTSEERMATAKINLKGLAKVTAKGRNYYYAWRGGPRIYAAYGTPEFLQEYLSLRSPESNIDRAKFGAWVSLYRASPNKRGGRPYSSLSEATRKNWGP